MTNLADKQNDDNDDYFDAYSKKVLPGVVEDEYKEHSEGQRMVKPPANLYQWWNAQDHIPFNPSNGVRPHLDTCYERRN